MRGKIGANGFGKDASTAKVFSGRGGAIHARVLIDESGNDLNCHHLRPLKKIIDLNYSPVSFMDGVEVYVAPIVN